MNVSIAESCIHQPLDRGITFLEHTYHPYLVIIQILSPSVSVKAVASLLKDGKGVTQLLQTLATKHRALPVSKSTSPLTSGSPPPTALLSPCRTFSRTASNSSLIILCYQRPAPTLRPVRTALSSLTPLPLVQSSITCTPNS